MYLAGLIADDARMTKRDLNKWAASAYGGALTGSTVPWVAAEGGHSYELALQWVESAKAHVAVVGWSTLSCIVALRDDVELDLPHLKALLRRVEETIHQAPNEVRYAMNGFVISVGCYVAPLADFAIQTAERIGEVTVDIGHTACQVPFGPDCIRNAQARGTIGRKRKTVKC